MLILFSALVINKLLLSDNFALSLARPRILMVLDVFSCTTQATPYVKNTVLDDIEILNKKCSFRSLSLVMDC